MIDTPIQDKLNEVIDNLERMYVKPKKIVLSTRKAAEFYNEILSVGVTDIATYKGLKIECDRALGVNDFLIV